MEKKLEHEIVTVDLRGFLRIITNIVGLDPLCNYACGNFT